jgi:hypothetical protein
LNEKVLHGYFESIEPYNSSFKKVTIKVFAFGKNQKFSNITPQSFELAQNTIYSIPLVSKYIEDVTDEYGFEGDLSGHNMKLRKIKTPEGKTLWEIYQDTTPLGVVPADAEIYFEDINEGTEEKPDIKTYIVAKGCLLWMRYDAAKKIEGWLSNGIKPKVSMEIGNIQGEIIDNYFTVNNFEFEAICAIGSDKTPAFPRAEITNFSKENFEKMYSEMLKELKELTEKDLNFIKKEDIGTGDKISISLTKEDAYEGSWGDVDKTALRNKLLKAKNYKSLVSKTYLMVKDGWEDSPSSLLKYPVCKVSTIDGVETLVLAVKGCQSALSYLEKNTDDPDYSKAKAKLEKYYNILDLSTENFSVDNIKNKNEGGNSVDEKLELISKYSNLTEEDVKELKADIDKYSLEEFDTKLKELSESKNKDFEMTNEQLMSAVFKALEARQVTKTDYYGESYLTNEFYYCDLKENHVICIDHTWSAYYGIPYTVDGDNVVLDFDNKVEYLPDWRVKESGSADFSLVKNIVEAEVKHNVEKAEAKFSAVESPEYKELKLQYETLKTEKSTLESEKSALQIQVSQFEAENTELKTFKETTLTNQRTDAENALFERFSEKLSEEELKPFKDSAKDFSLEQLEEKLSAFAFKKMTKFEHTQKPKVNVVVDRTNTFEIKTGKPYDDILEKYASTE